MLNILVIVAMAAAGVVIGPFLRSAIVHHAVPGGQTPLESCPRCGTRFAGRARLGVRRPLPPSGRCPQCRTRLGPPGGSVELVTAGVLGLFAWRVADPPVLFGLSLAAIAGIALSFVDLRVHRLPNRLVLAGAIATIGAFTLAAVWERDLPRLGIAALCGLGTVAAYLLLALIPAGYGLGDVKASALTGFVAGWYGIAAAAGAFVSGLVLAGLAAIAVLVIRRARARRSIAHGPYMFIGALLAVLLAAG